MIGYGAGVNGHRRSAYPDRSRTETQQKAPQSRPASCLSNPAASGGVKLRNRENSMRKMRNVIAAMLLATAGYFIYLLASRTYPADEMIASGLARVEARLERAAD